MSCNDVDANSDKWTCKRCTYDNFSKSIKCTICLAPNSPAYIIDEVKFNDESTGNDPNNLTVSNESKWDCSLCTYSNFPKSIKCSICSTPKQSSSIQEDFNSQSNCSSIDSEEDKNKNLIKLNNLNKIKNNFTDKEPNQESIDNQKTKLNNKPSTSTAKRIESSCDLDNSSSSNSLNHSLNNDALNDKLIDNQTANKWKCRACTYFNFEKSLKCSICLSPKVNSVESSAINNLSNSNSLNSSLNNEAICSIDKNNTASQRNTPSPIIGATCQQQRNRINGNLNNVNTIMNYNNLNRRKNRDFVDLNWLDAVVGVLNPPGDPEPVLVYLNNGGDLARQLTHVETTFLNKPTLVGYTLVHLAIRFKRNEILEILLENHGREQNRAKRVPCSVSITYGNEVRKLINNSLKQRKGDFPCYFVSEFVNFALPQEILELSPNKQECLFEDLLDKEVMNELEESSIINWSLELNVTLGSRLYALWNRSTGDCLLDSVLQSSYGVFDKDNVLRKALADSLNDAAQIFFSRFKEAETLKVSHQLPYTLDNMQWSEDWAIICSIASHPGSALEKFHIFVLSHILRRPIVVYGVKFVKSYRGEKLALAGFQGLYLPLHFPEKFCNKSPIALAYTKGHFTSLVPMENVASCVMMSCNCDANGEVNNDCSHLVVNGALSGNLVKNNVESDCCYLPLVTSERELLPLQFLVEKELNRQEEIMRQYLDCCVTEEGLLVCKMKLNKRPFSVQQMINEWIDFYRSMPVVSCSNDCKLITSSEHESSSPKITNETTNYLSDSD